VTPNIVAVVPLEGSTRRLLVRQTADVDPRKLQFAAALIVALQFRSRRIQGELLAANHEHLWILRRLHELLAGGLVGDAADVDHLVACTTTKE
jgi:hypothetical protein